MRVRDAELQLVGDDGLLHILLQQLDLHLALVANSEMPDFPVCMQDCERLCNLLGLHQRVRAMQQQYINVLRLQPLKAAVYGIQNMFFGKVKVSVTDSALGLNVNFISGDRF